MKSMRSGPFLTRLGQDTSGNTLALMAAAFFPLAGLIGGGVDITRIYITKARLQQACDAGALAGRKTMGSGSWTTTGTNSSLGHANQLFAANFQDGDYGSSDLESDFDEDDGTVTGTASATVPMTIMKIFGKTDHEVAVTCTAQMEIPNTDVMFVLDTTFSMETDDRIGGLQSAVKCFYEALLKVNTTEPCTPGANAWSPYTEANDPTSSNYEGTAQIRLGFVPYAVNVNVGRLLPNELISDTWPYQTRRPNFETRYSWVAGATGTTTWGNWSGAPSNINAQNQYSGWTDRPTSPANITINSTSYAVRRDLNETSCNALNTIGPSGNKMLAYVDSAGSPGSATQVGTPAAPTHPATTQTVNYNQERTHSVTGYKYRYVSGQSGSNRCRLQSGTRTYTADRDGTAPKPVTWTEHEVWDGTWTYSEQTLNVSALKAGDSDWNTTGVALTHTESGRFTGTTPGPTVKLSGSNSSTTLAIPGNLTVNWNGCIQERATHQNTDGTPGDEWDPIPDTALDMLINHVPSSATPAQAWGPMLQDAVWGRYTGSSGSTRTLDARADIPNSRNFPRPTTWCPTEARKLRPYNTVGDMETYIDGLNTDSLGTYHDIGLLWGARLLSPVGIFADENALTANGGAIERHLIFMTDGNAQTVVDNLYAYGYPWWDRKQTSYAPSTGNLDTLVNARMLALCTAVKNMNIKLWVISYGGDVNEDNEERLELCASPGHFYSADDGPALISRFKQIASEIADLRLTQ